MSVETEKVDLESPDLAAATRSGFEELLPGVLADGVLDAARLGGCSTDHPKPLRAITHQGSS
jgi:hypothetical protein